MTIPTRFGMGAFPALLLALACGPNSADEIVSPQLNVADASSGPAASGHGNWINAAGEYVSRSFQGREMPDGSVEGNFVQHITAVNGDKRVNKGDIICLLVGPVEAIGLGANEAYSAVQFTRTSIPTLSDGLRFFGSGTTEKAAIRRTRRAGFSSGVPNRGSIAETSCLQS